MKINSWIWMNELARKQQNNTTVPISLTWRKSQLIKNVRKWKGKLVFGKVIECLCVIRAEEKRLLVWSGIDRRCWWRVGLCKEGYRRCVVWWDWSEVLRDWRVLVEREGNEKRRNRVRVSKRRVILHWRGDGCGARALGPVRVASLVGERWAKGFKGLFGTVTEIIVENNFYL